VVDLRVVDSDMCALQEEVTDERDGGRLAGVSCVGLEREAENSDALTKHVSGVIDGVIGGNTPCP